MSPSAMLYNMHKLHISLFIHFIQARFCSGKLFKLPIEVILYATSIILVCQVLKLSHISEQSISFTGYVFIMILNHLPEIKHFLKCPLTQPD